MGRTSRLLRCKIGETLLVPFAGFPQLAMGCASALGRPCRGALVARFQISNLRNATLSLRGHVARMIRVLIVLLISPLGRTSSCLSEDTR
jgi:hypothetical protein